MVVKFWPSLELLASVRIAHEMLHPVSSKIFAARGNISFEDLPEMEFRIKALSSIVSIPRLIEKNVFGIAQDICLEIYYWFLVHNEIVPDTDLDLSNVLCWYSYGIIDKFKTAKILVQDENINMKQRFVLACKYFFEDHARILWDHLSPDDQLYIESHYSSLACMGFWTSKVQIHDPIDSIHMFHSTEYFDENYLGIRYYFKELRLQAKYRCISYGLAKGQIHHFDLYLCLAEMRLAEVKSLFHRLSASNRLKAMELFLYWPLQCIFVETIDLLWKFISHYNFRNILNFIIRERIVHQWIDMHYTKLVQEVWARCPLSYKSRLKRDPNYQVLKIFIDYRAT